LGTEPLSRRGTQVVPGLRDGLLWSEGGFALLAQDDRKQWYEAPPTDYQNLRGLAVQRSGYFPYGDIPSTTLFYSGGNPQDLRGVCPRGFPTFCGECRSNHLQCGDKNARALYPIVLRGVWKGYLRATKSTGQASGTLGFRACGKPSKPKNAIENGTTL
jgi:hypothetical protein